jgi:glycosyltransferase involved in cell wall biosynthesis
MARHGRSQAPRTLAQRPRRRSAAETKGHRVLQCWVVVPAFNEAESLPILVPRIVEALLDLNPENRVLVVDDGSTDDSRKVLSHLTAAFASVQVIHLRRNTGKAAALRRGFETVLAAGGEAIVMMDADGQDDPAEIANLLAKLGEGYDLVTGARSARQDRFIKRHTSRLYNWVTGILSGVPGRDFNSGLKAMRPVVAADVSNALYGELHRYLTVIAHWLGYRVTEIPVQHHERVAGVTKYGPARFWRGFMDLLTVRFLMNYEHRPSHFFGAVGFFSLGSGSFILVYLAALRLSGEAIGNRPALLAGILLVLVGVQLLVFGLLADLVVYNRNRDRPRAE